MRIPSRAARCHVAACAPESEFTRERSVSFRIGDLFYRPNSRLIRDLGVLALAVMHNERGGTSAPPLRVLDAMSGTGVRSLRYALETGGDTYVHSNELQFGNHPLRENLKDIVASGVCEVTNDDAVNLYLRAKLDSNRYDFVDCDAFGTGQPHTAEAWWAVAKGGLLYLCATDSCTTDGHNPHKAMSGYAAVAHRFPASNEQGLRLLLGAAWREAAARNLHAQPIFSYFHKPSSSFRVMLRLHKPKRPPAHAYDSLAHVRRCVRTGQLWAVPSTDLGRAFRSGSRGTSASASASPADDDKELAAAGGMEEGQQQREEQQQLIGPLWVGPMHDADFVDRMRQAAEAREWDDAASLLRMFGDEAIAEAGGALLYYHLGEVQRALQASHLDQPPLSELISLLRAEGHTAAKTHIERKALKTSATLEEVVELVRKRAEAAAAGAQRAPDQ